MKASPDLSYTPKNQSAKGKAQPSVQHSIAQAEESCRLWLELLPYASPQWAELAFHEQCFWRDFLAYTWTIKTLEGKSAIAAMVQ